MTVWRDKKAKPVVIVSTWEEVKDVVVQCKSGEVSIPSIVYEYNLSMNGCDKVDQMVNYYGHYQRKTTKWLKRIFYWLLEIAQVNSYILYKLQKSLPNLSFKYHKTALVMQLLERVTELGDDSAPSRALGRPTSSPVERLGPGRHLVDYVKADRNCVVCSGTVCRRTNFVCTGCSDTPHLHPKGCFKI